MRKTLTTLLAGAALATLGGGASAQTPYGGYGYGQPTATLYELPNFLGRSVTVRGEDANLSGSGFNDRARSARLEGAWSVCVDANYRGHCETLTGSVPFLPHGLSGSASSLRSSGYGGYPGYPGYPGQPGTPGAGTAVLYELPNFQGRSVVVNNAEGNLENVNFNDRARSARFTGTWRVCEHAGFRGRCETFSGPVANLAVRINGVSSLQMTGGHGGYPGYPGQPGYGDGHGVEGRSVVFYPGPAAAGGGYGYGQTYGGWSATRRGANDFCRHNRHNAAVWYDTAGGTLSDVLCRR